MTMFPATWLSARRPAARFDLAARPDAHLFEAVLGDDDRLATLDRVGKTRRLRELLDHRAWTEAALELVALAAPSWSVQRLCRDDGEWLCTLTTHPDLPDWLDDSAEGRNPSLPLAILAALAEAQGTRHIIGNQSR
jgi:hypothetical protein